MKLSLIFLPALLSTLFAYEPNPYFETIPDKSWQQIPGTIMADVASPITYSGTAPYGFAIYAYSGAVKDTMNGRIIFWGGGHGDYLGNDVYQFNLDSLNWRRAMDPYANYQAECTDRVHHFADSTPKPRHTYDQMCYIYHQNKFWAYGGSICGPGSGIKDMWSLDLSAKKWTDLDPSYLWTWNMNLAQSCEYDPVTRKVYYFDGYMDIKAYNPDDNTWSSTLSSYSYANERASVLCPRLRKIVTYGGYEDTLNNQIMFYNIDAKTVEYASVPSYVPGGRAQGFAFDSQNELFLTYGGYNNPSRTVWYYDVETNHWFAENIPGGPDFSHFSYERLVYDDVNQVTLLFRTPFENVWVLKNRALVNTAAEKKNVAHLPELSVSPNPGYYPSGITIKTAPGAIVGIYNVSGALVRQYTAGKETGHFNWDGRNEEGKKMVAGIYLCKARWDNRVVSRKISLMK